ncbi:MAG: CehA/McbA family metallohydrolase [Armatimonadota bacterium]
MSARTVSRRYGAKTRTIDLSRHFSFPRGAPRDRWWRELAERVRKLPSGEQRPWGIPFSMAPEKGPRAVLAAKGRPEVVIELGAPADYLCLLHQWYQLPQDIRTEYPTEGLVVAEYRLEYDDGTCHVQPVRGRFEVAMVESPGPIWLAQPFYMMRAVDPVKPPEGYHWGWAQYGVDTQHGEPPLYALPNPNPKKRIRSLRIRGLLDSPLLIFGLTLYRGPSHPLQHLPRRAYRINTPEGPAKVAKAEVDLGGIIRIQRTLGPRGRDWLASPYAGLIDAEPEWGAEDLLEIHGAPDATVSVRLDGRKRPLKFSLGEAFNGGRSESGGARLEVLGKRRQWMKVRVVDASTGEPTAVRIHFSGPRGEYIAPYGHHEQINANWFEDYGADVLVGNRSYAYVNGEFVTDMPVGDIYAEIYKGFEYQPVRTKVTVRPGQDVLELRIDRWKNLRAEGWVTADTHVHFISPHTAWLEAQAEGVNVVNLLASQWGRLFTNVGDITGRVGINENDTIVYVGTENRNHMLGHMSMLGTQGLPVYPMCCGGPSEAAIGDPDFMTLAEWAAENRRKGGLVVRPHFPGCGHTEDPVPILKGLVDALEIRLDDFAIQEWYRYLNCGYRVAVVGGTDKMGAYCALGWLRTYAKLDTNEPFTYDNWADAVRAGRTISTNGPLIDIKVDGKSIGESIEMPEGGGTVEVHATAECFSPLGKLQVIVNGQIAAEEAAPNGSRSLRVKQKIRITNSGWIAARCAARPGLPGAYLAAHTSPIYVKCGDTRAFDGPAAEHMLALVEGGIEYLNTIATVFDESSRKRMVKLFKEAREELRGRLIVEARHTHHHGDGPYHTHGHGAVPDHTH